VGRATSSQEPPPERCAVAVTRFQAPWVIEVSISSASSHVANAPTPATRSSARRARETIGVGTCANGRLRFSERRIVRTMSLWLRVSGPANS
jgi:hypothetical protein